NECRRVERRERRRGAEKREREERRRESLHRFSFSNGAGSIIRLPGRARPSRIISDNNSGRALRARAISPRTLRRADWFSTSLRTPPCGADPARAGFLGDTRETRLVSAPPPFGRSPAHRSAGLHPVPVPR